MRYLGGHLGSIVSALVDGQLDQGTADRAWAHVHTCASCRGQVEREGWVKTRLSRISEPHSDLVPDRLVGSLNRLPGGASDEPAAAWAAVAQLEQRARGRRLAGIAAVGAGSVSVAVLGFASLSGATLGIGGAPADAPNTSVSRPSTPTTASVGPAAHVHGRVPGLHAGRGLHP